MRVAAFAGWNSQKEVLHLGPPLRGDGSVLIYRDQIELVQVMQTHAAP